MLARRGRSLFQCQFDVGPASACATVLREKELHDPFESVSWERQQQIKSKPKDVLRLNWVDMARFMPRLTKLGVLGIICYRQGAPLELSAWRDGHGWGGERHNQATGPDGVWLKVGAALTELLRAGLSPPRLVGTLAPPSPAFDLSLPMNAGPKIIRKWF